MIHKFSSSGVLRVYVYVTRSPHPIFYDRYQFLTSLEIWNKKHIVSKMHLLLTIQNNLYLLNNYWTKLLDKMYEYNR